MKHPPGEEEIQRLVRLAAEAGACIDRQNASVLLTHLEQVQCGGAAVRLTAITSFEEGLVLHVVDSLSAVAELRSAPEGRIADIGSGGGYPGIPLSVASKRDAVLIESSSKKAQRLLEIVSGLGLANVSVERARCEELAARGADGFAAVTARALAGLGSLVELAAPLLVCGGILVALKGHVSEEEMLRASRTARVAGMRLASRREFPLPGSEDLGGGTVRRTIVTYVREREPSIRLPRRPGMAQKRPVG